MNPLGWAFMSISWLIIILLFLFCFVKIFKQKEE